MMANTLEHFHIKETVYEYISLHKNGIGSVSEKGNPEHFLRGLEQQYFDLSISCIDILEQNQSSSIQ